MKSTNEKLKLKITRNLFRLMRLTSWIGTALDLVAIILLSNLNKPYTAMLIHMALMLACAYVASAGIERVDTLLKGTKDAD